MIEILLISLYVISIILCGYCYYTLTVDELKKSSGIINAGLLFTRSLITFIPIANISIAIAYFMVFLYNTEIKFNIKDKND